MNTHDTTNTILQMIDSGKTTDEIILALPGTDTQEILAIVQACAISQMPAPKKELLQNVIAQVASPVTETADDRLNTTEKLHSNTSFFSTLNHMFSMNKQLAWSTGGVFAVVLALGSAFLWYSSPTDLVQVEQNLAQVETDIFQDVALLDDVAFDELEIDTALAALSDESLSEDDIAETVAATSELPTLDEVLDEELDALFDDLNELDTLEFLDNLEAELHLLT